MNAVRLWVSPCSIWMASCSCADFDWPFCCHNCSQEACWYFWMTLSAIMSRSGYCAPTMPTKSSKGTRANREKRRIITVSFLTRFPPQRSLLEHGILPSPSHVPRASGSRHASQDAADERQQLCQRVEVRHLPRDDMLDAS